MGPRDMFAVKVCVFPERGTHLGVVTCVLKEHHDHQMLARKHFSSPREGQGGWYRGELRDMFALKVCVFPERGTHLGVVTCVPV